MANRIGIGFNRDPGYGRVLQGEPGEDIEQGPQVGELEAPPQAVAVRRAPADDREFERIRHDFVRAAVRRVEGRDAHEYWTLLEAPERREDRLGQNRGILDLRAERERANQIRRELEDRFITATRELCSVESAGDLNAESAVANPQLVTAFEGLRRAELDRARNAREIPVDAATTALANARTNFALVAAARAELIDPREVQTAVGNPQNSPAEIPIAITLARLELVRAEQAHDDAVAGGDLETIENAQHRLQSARAAFASLKQDAARLHLWSRVGSALTGATCITAAYILGIVYLRSVIRSTPVALSIDPLPLLGQILLPSAGSVCATAPLSRSMNRPNMFSGVRITSSLSQNVSRVLSTPTLRREMAIAGTVALVTSAFFLTFCPILPGLNLRDRVITSFESAFLAALMAAIAEGVYAWQTHR